MKSELCELLGIQYPIIQGAMAWVADADLASAVSNAGGLGLIGTGHDSVDVANEKISKMKALTDKPFGVNIMLLNPHVDAIVEAVIAAGVKVVTTGAGRPVWRCQFCQRKPQGAGYYACSRRCGPHDHCHAAEQYRAVVAQAQGPGLAKNGEPHGIQRGC